MNFFQEFLAYPAFMSTSLHIISWSLCIVTVPAQSLCQQRLDAILVHMHVRRVFDLNDTESITGRSSCDCGLFLNFVLSSFKVHVQVTLLWHL